MINFDEMLLGKIDGIRRGGRATKPPRIMTKCNFAWAVGVLMKVEMALMRRSVQSRCVRFFLFCRRELVPMAQGIKRKLSSNGFR